MLRLFVNILTADEKNSRHNTDNFPQQIQVQFSQKPKAFSQFSIAFLKMHQIVSILKKKYESHRLSISKIIDSERGVYLNV